MEFVNHKADAAPSCLIGDGCSCRVLRLIQSGLACSHWPITGLVFLAGFSDPVYAEAYVTVHQYDIVLDVTVINRTNETLQNLCLELATMGDLKLVERPHNYTLGPNAAKSIRLASA